MASSVLKILTASQAISATSGLDSLRVDEVARRSGLNKRMIYHYFGNKEGLQCALLDWQIEILQVSQWLDANESSWLRGSLKTQPNDSLGGRDPEKVILQSDKVSESFAPGAQRMAARILASRLCLDTSKAESGEESMVKALLQRLIFLAVLNHGDSTSVEKSERIEERQAKPRLRIRSQTRAKSS